MYGASRFQPQVNLFGSYTPRYFDTFDSIFTMAFQPIVNFSNKSIFGYQALVRGPKNQDAEYVLSKLTDTNRYQFDQDVRHKSIRMASHLKLPGMLSINFLPNAVLHPEACIQATLKTAAELNFPRDRIMLLLNERDEFVDHEYVNVIFEEYKKQGFKTAIDNFGAGYSGLNRLADCQPDVIKLDASLTNNVHKDRVKRSIVSGLIRVCNALSIEIIAEGIESKEQRDFLYSAGVKLFQGYYFAKPGFESLPVLNDDCYFD